MRLNGASCSDAMKSPCSRPLMGMSVRRTLADEQVWLEFWKGGAAHSICVPRSRLRQWRLDLIADGAVLIRSVSAGVAAEVAA